MKKKGNYIKKLAGEKEREVISYEDAPLDEIKDSEPLPANATKTFFKGFLILVISVVVVMAVTNIDKLTPENISHWVAYDLLGMSEGEGYPASFSGADVDTGNFDLMDGVPVYCSDTSITVLNSNAGKYQEVNHAFANPILSTNSSYSIVYNEGATGYTIIDRDSVVKTGLTEKKIFCADVCPKGIYCILSEDDDYLAKLTVYRKDDLEMYQYSFADFYVNRVSINTDGTRAVVSGLSAKNGSLLSVLYVLDFSQGNYMQRYEFDEIYMYDIKYLDNGNAVAVGDKSAYYIDINGGSKKNIEYHSKFLTCYTLDRKNGMLLSLSSTPDGKECEVLMTDENGKNTADIMTNRQVLSMDYRNDRVAVLFDREACVYNMKGKKVGEIPSKSDSRKIRFADINSVYILGKSSLYNISAKE